MKKHKIDIGIHWTPLHKFKYFLNKSKANDLKETSVIGREIATLPLYSKMTKEDLRYITNAINKYS